MNKKKFSSSNPNKYSDRNNPINQFRERKILIQYVNAAAVELSRFVNSVCLLIKIQFGSEACEKNTHRDKRLAMPA